MNFLQEESQGDTFNTYLNKNIHSWLHIKGDTIETRVGKIENLEVKNIIPSAGGVVDDGFLKSKVSANDTQEDFLNNSIVGGQGISKQILNPSADEQLELSVNPSEINLQDFSGIVPVVKGGTGKNLLNTNKFLVGNGTLIDHISKDVPEGDVVGTTDIQTLTNKRIFNSSNVISASHLGTSGTPVKVSDATPPTAGQVLKAIDANTASWQVDASGTDENVKITTNDTTAGFLDDKVAVTAKLSKTILNPAANEQLQLDLGSVALNDLSDVNKTGEAQGDILYRNATEWVNLGAGTSGDVLTTNGVGANPSWNTPTYENTSASNVGTAGVGVFRDKTGDQLNFKKINAGSTKITITDDVGNDEVDIDMNPAVLNLTDLGDVTASGAAECEGLVRRSGFWVNEKIKNCGFVVLNTNPSTAEVYKMNYIDLRVLSTMTINLPTSGVNVGDLLIFRVWRIDANTPTSFTLDAGAGNNVDAIDGPIVDTPVQTATYTLTGGSNDLEGQFYVFDACTVSPLQWRLISQSYTKLHQQRDIERATPSNNDVLVYNSGSSIWEHKVLTSASLPADVVYTGAAQTLTNKTMDWNNNTFQNFPFQSAGTNRLMPNSVSVTLSTNQNNYSPVGLSTANKLVINATINVDITGINSSVFTAADGVVLSICSVGTNDVKLKMEDALSTAANRFKIKADVNIEANEAVIIVYVGGSVNRWLVLSHI